MALELLYEEAKPSITPRLFVWGSAVHKFKTTTVLFAVTEEL